MSDWMDRFFEVVSEVKVACLCQVRNVPAENGCAFCEGSGTRTIEVRRDGAVRISRGVYPATDWRPA